MKISNICGFEGLKDLPLKYHGTPSGLTQTEPRRVRAALVRATENYTTGFNVVAELTSCSMLIHDQKFAGKKEKVGNFIFT